MKWIIFLISVSLFLSQSGTMGLSVFAQNNASSQNSSGISSMENQTAATLTGQPETAIVNKTTIPAEQTTVTVNQTTEQIQGQADLQPIGNQTLTQQTAQLSNLENETMVQPTGPALTTIVNQTTVPFNQTTLEMGELNETQQQSGVGNQTNQTSPQQQSGGGNQTNQTSPQQQSGGGNQTGQGPLEQIGESINNLVGGGGGQ